MVPCPMVAHLAAAEVYNAAGRIEKPRVRIPLLYRGGVPPVIPCETFDGGYCAAAGDARGGG